MVNKMAHFTKVKTKISDLFILEPVLFEDERGYFLEEYSEKEFIKLGLTMKFVQSNEVMSKKNVLRGLHFQVKHPQGKLIRVVQGEIYDVVVDLRTDSKTYGEWLGVELSSKNKRQLYIPEGFAHGYFVKDDNTNVCFKVSDYWYPENEIGIPWNDVSLNIDWKIPENIVPIIAEKDMHYLPINQTIMKRGKDENIINS